MAAPPAVQPTIRVLLVIDQPDDPFAERIRAELSGLGLTVVALEPWRTGEPVASLEAAARAEQAVAAVRMIPTRRGVEVWLADQSMGRPLLRQLVVDENPDGPNQGLVALQTAELLRTSLLSGSSPARVASASPSPSIAGPPHTSDASVVVAPAEPSRPPPGEAGLQAAVGTLFSPGGAGSSLQLWLSLHRAFSPRLGAALDLSGPLRSATISAEEGSARVGTYLAGIALFVHLDPPASGLHGAFGAGAALMRVSFDGDASGALVAQAQSAITGAGYLRADAEIDATHWLRFGLRTVAGLATDRVNATFAGNDVGGWGRSFFAAFFLADLCWH